MTSGRASVRTTRSPHPSSARRLQAPLGHRVVDPLEAGLHIGPALFQGRIGFRLQRHVADLTGADLQGANLAGANLSRADLSGATLAGVDLSGLDLQGARLAGATPADLLNVVRRLYTERAGATGGRSESI